MVASITTMVIIQTLKSLRELTFHMDILRHLISIIPMTMLSGCIIEEDIVYHGNDIKPHGYRKIMESQQACADFCKTIMGGKFWSWSSGDKLCYVKSSSSGRKSVSGKVSGNRECGSGKDIQSYICLCEKLYLYQLNYFQPVNDFQSTSMSRPAAHSWPTL